MIAIMPDMAILRAAKAINWFGYAIMGEAMEASGIPADTSLADWPPSQDAMDQVWLDVEPHIKEMCLQLAREALRYDGEEG